MKDFPWGEFYNRYVKDGEEFGFLYQDTYNIHFSNDKGMNANITLAIQNSITENNIKELLRIFGYQEIDFSTLTISEAVLEDKIIVSWKEVQFSTRQIIDKLLIGNSLFFINYKNKPFKIYSYRNNRETLICAISRVFETREMLLDEVEINGLGFEQVYKDLI